MNRRSVIRCILGLAVAPKILAEINLAPVTPVTTASFFNDLNFSVPDYLPQILKKYGSTDFVFYPYPPSGNWELVKDEKPIS